MSIPVSFFTLFYLLAGVMSTSSWPMAQQAAPAPDMRGSEPPVGFTPDNLGINLPWLDLHTGRQAYASWLNVDYVPSLIEDDLAAISSLGIRKIRAWCTMESVFNFRDDGFVLNPRYASNLDDFLERAGKHGISVICVMGDGNAEGEPQDLDGRVRAGLVRTDEGIGIYTRAYADYLERFGRHGNVLMWEIMNEPYGALGWSERMREAGVTQHEIHRFLVAAYGTIKPLAGATPVGFSEYEEEQQPKYRIFSSPENRRALVDDCTDVYSMHIYRASASQVADFRSLEGKPKWVVELGSYNYDDPLAVGHPIPARNELYRTGENFDAVVQLSRKLLDEGFSLVMPWAFASNDGMVLHNRDGTHTLLRLPLFLKAQLARPAPSSATP